MLDPFGLPDQVSHLEARLRQEQSGLEGLRAGVALSWYLRQRDTRRALALAAETQHRLALSSDVPPIERLRMTSRLCLTTAETYRLLARLEDAETAVREARDGFAAISDPTGQGDTETFMADLCTFKGDRIGQDHHLARAQGFFRAARDPVRLRCVEAWTARLETYANAAQAHQRWWNHLHRPDDVRHPAVLAQIANFEGGQCFQRSDFVGAIRHWQRVVEAATEVGNLWLAVNTMNVIGAAFANLHDYASAIEWKEKAHGLALDTGWPELMGSTLGSLAETTVALGQHDRARALFDRALEYLEPLARSRRYVITGIALGNLHLACGRHQEALDWFETARDTAVKLGHPDVELNAVRGTAEALARLDRPAEALVPARTALDRARQNDNRYQEIAVLRVMADIFRRLPPGPAVPDPASQATAHLERAIAIGETLEGYTVPAEILAELSADHEQRGDLTRALHYERRARQSFQEIYNQETNDRLLAAQLRFETQRAREEAEHLKALAQAETARAAMLDETNTTLELLGRIGQAITASLDTEAVFEALHRHMNELLHAPAMLIGLIDPTRQRLEMRFRIEDGRRLPPSTLALDDSISYSVLSVRENREVLLKRGRGVEEASHIPGTRAMLTMLFRPLAVGDRVMGVLSVQSDRPEAYGPRELQIIRTLGAYGAIALANAEAYRSLDAAVADLRDARGRLMQQERLASLGQLVAGMAREVAAPVGTVAGLAGFVAEEVGRLRTRAGAGPVPRPVLREFLDTVEESSRMMAGTARRVIGLLDAFHHVAADRGSDAAREIDLTDYLREVLATAEPLLRPAGLEVRLSGPEGVRITTCPGLLAQAVANLVQNAVDRVFPRADRGPGTDRGKDGPGLSVTVTPAPDGGASIIVSDDGPLDGGSLDGGPLDDSPSQQGRAHFFEPLFAVPPPEAAPEALAPGGFDGDAGSLLDLQIVHAVVTGPLQGRMELGETGRGGPCVILHLPPAVSGAAALRSPRRPAA